MTFSAANSPAEACIIKDMSPACNGLKPTFLAAMPMVKATTKYPRLMGSPALIPLRKGRLAIGAAETSVCESCILSH